MKKPELRLHCFYAPEGEAAKDLILRSFALFLRRELEAAKPKPPSKG